MDALKFFILGYVFIYVSQILDITVNLINAFVSVVATKCQVKIDKTGANYEVKEPLFGFQYNPEEEEYCDDDYEDKI